MDSDLLFPIAEQAFLAEHIARSHFETISSLFGHDGFLTETVLVDELMRDFVCNEFRNFRKTTFRSLKKRSV